MKEEDCNEEKKENSRNVEIKIPCDECDHCAYQKCITKIKCLKMYEKEK